MIDDFLIDMKNSESVSKKLSLGYAKNSRLGNHIHHQNVGLYDESFEVEATFYNKKRSLFDDFETKIKEKNPLLLTFGDGRSYEVVIVQCEIIKSFFDDNGSPIKQEIKLSIEVYYE